MIYWLIAYWRSHRMLSVFYRLLKDDGVVPIHLGRKLYAIAQSRAAPVSLITFDRELGYGHKGIYRDPRLPQIVNDFFDVCRSHRSTAAEQAAVIPEVAA